MPSPHDRCECGAEKDPRAARCRACWRDLTEPGATRTCTKCERELPLDAFRVRTRAVPRPRSRCKKCEAAEQRERTATRSPSKRAARSAMRKRWSKANPYIVRAMSIRQWCKRHGVTTDPEIIIAHDLATECCEACARPRCEVGTLHVDHDHNSGAFRGLLCQGCNIGVGHFGDDPERLCAAARYLSAAHR